MRDWRIYMSMIKKELTWAIDNRNRLFLGMCYVVHFLLMILFAFLGIWGMVILNAISFIFYTVIVMMKRNFSENAVVAAYFEIIFFATLSTIMVGRQAGFLLYIVGMISVVFYLSYNHGNKRFIYQGIGVVFVLALFLSEPVTKNLFVTYKEMIEPYCRSLYFMNLLVTLLTVLIVSFLYAHEINRMNREIVDMAAEMDYMATHDELTGLLNRHEMNHYIDEVSNSHLRHFIVAMMDVDDFKIINDNYGHGGGDLVLVTISKLIDEHLSDFRVARWGGEEFLLISDNYSWEEGIAKVEQFHKAVSCTKVAYQGKDITMHLTIGAVPGKDTRDISHLILEADNLLYIGKSSKKDCVVTYDNMDCYKK